MTRHTATPDSPLPLEEFAELAEVDQLRAALADALTYIENPARPAPANRVRAWRVLAGREAVPGLADLTPQERRDEGTARAAARWTAEEEVEVDNAIRRVVEQRRAAYRRAGQADERLLEFTTADVWAYLNRYRPDVPVTKGITGRMLAAKGAGVIASTGRIVIAPKESTGPNHGQRLTVWRAL